MSHTSNTNQKITPYDEENDLEEKECFDSSILAKIDIESINKNNKNISNHTFISLDFIYIKRRKYAMYNTEVKRKCIEMVSF